MGKRTKWWLGNALLIIGISFLVGFILLPIGLGVEILMAVDFAIALIVVGWDLRRKIGNRILPGTTTNVVRAI